MLTSKQVLEKIRRKRKKYYFIIFSLSDSGYHTELEIEGKIYDTFEKARDSIIFNNGNTDYDYGKYDTFELGECSWVYETYDQDYFILSLYTNKRYLHLSACCQELPDTEVSDDCDFITYLKESVSRDVANNDNHVSGTYIVFDLYNYDEIQEWDGSCLECYRSDKYYETKKDILKKLAHMMYKRIWYKRLATYLNSNAFSEWYYSPIGPGGKRVIRRLQAKSQLETSNPPP